MVEKGKYWKIMIKGPSIQGVMLREAIVSLKDVKKDSEEPEKKVATALETVKGFARNFQDHVEVIFIGSKSQAEILLEAIKAIPDSPKSMGIVSYECDPKLEEVASPLGIFSERDFQDFKVMRDNEQKEMMLALQGAGKLFRKSAGIQQNVSEQLRKRDEEKVKGLLLSIYYEAQDNVDALSGESPEGVSLIALQQGITTPPIPTAAFVYQITEVFRKLDEYKRLKEKMAPDPGETLIPLMDSFLGMLAKELEERNIKVD